MSDEAPLPKQRPFGLDNFTVNKEFFEPLPDELMAYFTGEKIDPIEE